MAIAGLAQYLPFRFEAGILFDRYHLLSALTLLWVRSGSQQELQGITIPPRPKRPVPTWSWASIDGRISHKLMQPSASWSLHHGKRVCRIDCTKDSPTKLLLKLRSPTFAFDKSKVHFIPDIQLKPGSTQNLQCVPILYYEASNKKKPKVIIHGIVVKKANIAELEIGMEMEMEEEPSQELERVGYFWLTTKDMSWKPEHSFGRTSLPTLVIV